MKPSFTPCFFSKASLCRLRRATTFVMSTSLKVVSMAAVFCACFSRSAMRFLRRVMRTRSSRAPAGRAAAGADGAGAAGVGATGAIVVLPRASRTASTSPLVSRPSLPEAAISLGSSLFSSISLRTAGASGSAAAAGFGVSLAGAFGVSLAAGLGAGAAAPSPITPSTAPTSTVLPASTRISLSVPAAGANTSSVTLSVSSSSSGSSTFIGSPTLFIHFATVASVTDSPRAGTTMFADMTTSIAERWDCGAPARSMLSEIQGLVDKECLLAVVAPQQAGCRRCRGGTADVEQAPLLVLDGGKDGFDLGAHERPGAHVARLFLAPEDLGLRPRAQLGGQRLGREREELLQSQEADVLDAAPLALLEQVVIDLAGAEDDALDLAVVAQRDVVVQHAVEGGARPHVRKLRDAQLVPQKGLRRHDDQGLAEVAMQLPSQRMEEVQRR